MKVDVSPTNWMFALRLGDMARSVTYKFRFSCLPLLQLHTMKVLSGVVYGILKLSIPRDIFSFYLVLL